MVTFANSDGGAIVVGVDEAGWQSDSPINAEELDSALRAAEHRCRPVIPTGWEQFEVEEGRGSLCAWHPAQSCTRSMMAVC